MVIISDKYGNLGLGNRLFVFAHFIANAIEHDYTLCYPAFHEYAHYFKETENNFFCRYPAPASPAKSGRSLQGPFCYLLNKFTSVYCKLHLSLEYVKALDITTRDDFDGDYDLDDQEFVGLCTASRFLFARGWAFRAERSIRKHADRVRQFLTPVDRHATNVSRLIDRARTGCDLLVGVHIRQGDYRTWLDGKYYYSTGVYADIVNQAGELWGTKRVRYLICSNEQQDQRLFEGLDYLFGNDHQLEDMYALAACDYLIGPPSTYTMWASFYGSVPLFTVEAPDALLTLEGFKVVEG